jgi:hypothetical protein
MNYHIESHGNYFYAVKKSDTGQVLATAMGLSTEQKAIKVIRNRWKHQGPIKILIDGTATRVIDAL